MESATKKFFADSDGSDNPGQVERVLNDPAHSEEIEVHPYFLAGSYILVLLCIALTLKRLIGIVLGQGNFPLLWEFFVLLIVVLPVLMLADILGTRYVVNSAYIERRGFFGTRQHFEWEDITRVVLLRPVSYARGILIKAGRRKFSFELGVFWWRRGFFRAAEGMMVIANSKAIPVVMKWPFFGESSKDYDIEYWLELGRQGLFWWSRPQLPPKVHTLKLKT